MAAMVAATVESRVDDRRELVDGAGEVVVHDHVVELAACSSWLLGARSSRSPISPALSVARSRSRRSSSASGRRRRRS